MTLQAIKKRLLDLAIRGQLVPQIPSEGTADNLLQQIADEHRATFAPLQGKKYKPLTFSNIPDSEIPFEIPTNWKWVRLGEIVDVRDGTHDTPKYIQEGYPLITSKDFCGDNFDLSKTKYISKVDYDLINQRSKVDIGDILFSMIGGNIGNKIMLTEQNYFDMAIKNVALFKRNKLLVSEKN